MTYHFETHNGEGRQSRPEMASEVKLFSLEPTHFEEVWLTTSPREFCLTRPDKKVGKTTSSEDSVWIHRSNVNSVATIHLPIEKRLEKQNVLEDRVCDAGGATLFRQGV